MVNAIQTFISTVVDVATGMIDAVVGGFTGIANAAIENPIIMVAVGIGLMLAGINYIPRLISMLRHR